MKIINVLIATFALASCVSAVAKSDDTLILYLSKSDLVISGKIVSELRSLTLDVGVVHYAFQYQVSDVCKGDAELKDKIIWVNIVRFENDQRDRHPLIKKNAESILFLKRAPKGAKPEWTTTDSWFGLQHPNSNLVFRTKVLEAKRLGGKDLVQEIIDAEQKRLYDGE